MNHPKTTPIHHGEKHGISRLHDKKTYYFRHYYLSSFALNLKGKQIPTEGLSLCMDHEKTSVMGTGRSLKVRASITRTRVSR